MENSASAMPADAKMDAQVREELDLAGSACADSGMQKREEA